MKTQYANSYGAFNFLSVFLPYIIFINWLLSDKLYLSESRTFREMTLVVIPSSLAIFTLIDVYARRVRRRLDDHRYAFKRGMLLFIVTFSSKYVFITLLFLVSDITGYSGVSLSSSEYYWALLATFLLSIIHAGLDEGAYVLANWKVTLMKTEQLEKNNLQSKLRKLKEQVNPHFLFNSLNCLSSLITEDKGKADKFLNEMSMVYRYLLNNNEESLTTLDMEIKFIQSYFHMQKTRYGERIELYVDVEEEYKEFLVPPLTLQLLIENAIKHNSVMEDNPLRIEIRSVQEGWLIISNNLLPKLVKPPSARIGLVNIIHKYQILNQPDIEIESNDQQFSVKIPLIRSEL